MYRVEMIICGAYSSLGASYLSPVLYDCSPVQVHMSLLVGVTNREKKGLDNWQPTLSFKSGRIVSFCYHLPRNSLHCVCTQTASPIHVCPNATKPV